MADPVVVGANVDRHGRATGIASARQRRLAKQRERQLQRRLDVQRHLDVARVRLIDLIDAV